jgi:3-dehydroquinate dehydratase-1/3-dehydroquinate dehydratase/shikimate dehydrogenase
MTQRGLICVAVAAANGEGVLTAVTPVLDLVDMVEIRLDALTDLRIEPCITALAKPVLVTNRPTWEGGAFRGSEEERLALLCRGLEAGARYVDIELRAEPASRTRILAAARSCSAQVLISSHDFEHTPTAAHLHATLEAMIESGADIGKIVTTAATPFPGTSTSTSSPRCSGSSM